MWKIISTFICCWCFLPLAWSDHLIIEPDMGRTPILNAIYQAKEQINLVMYGFTDETILNALLDQKIQGKSLKIILEEKPYKAFNENEKTISLLKKNNINWHGKVKPFRLVHEKTLVIDHQQALIMTFNFTHATFKKERNFALLIDDPKRVETIAALFNADWQQQAPTPIDDQVLLSPGNSREKLLNLISKTKSSIKLYAQTVNDYQIIGALAQAAKHGVKIKIMTSGKMQQKKYQYLSRAHINIRFNKQLYIHAKAFIFDNQKAIIGSLNLTRQSLDGNRELAVITQDQQVIKDLNHIFDRDWDDYDHNLLSS